MIYRLRSYDQSPPGGYFYVQPDPKGQSFPAQPMLEAQARIVLSYRVRNGLPRATYAECVVDVDHYQCARLGNNPAYCTPVNAGSPEQVALAANAPGMAPCSSCGAKVVV